MSIELDRAQQRRLLQIARESIGSSLRKDGQTEPTVDAIDATMNKVRGVFVSLHAGDDLRGCVGTMEGEKPLPEQVWRIARSAAFRDPRFPPIADSELDRVHLEISVLAPLVRTTPEEVQVGRDGLCISRGGKRGVLLPQVATDAAWTREDFLRATCRKAHLAADDWRLQETQIERFSAQVFSERSLQS